MAIPDFQTLMLSVLRLSSEVESLTSHVAGARLAAEFALTDEELRQLLPSGAQRVFDNRIGWARTYLRQAGLVVSPKRGVSVITPAGRQLLQENLPRIDMRVLERYECYRAFKSRRRTLGDEMPADADRSVTAYQDRSEITPEEAMEYAYKRLRNSLESELLDQIKAASPAFFERLVVDLLIAMGYGGSRKEAGKAIGQSGDGGIDGVINEDRLGLDVIYLQAKRWEASVGRPEIQKFAGALQGQRAHKGVFITTSSFTRDAIDYAGKIVTKIILIDGETLVALMFDHGVGVSKVGSYEIKRVDSDYFDSP